MQSESTLISAKNCPKPGPNVSTPLNKSLCGACLNNPVIASPGLDSTRLKYEPGGIGHSPTSGTCLTQSTISEVTRSQPASPTYSSVVQSTGPKEVVIINKDKRPAPSQAILSNQGEQDWQEVRHGKKKKPTTYPKEVPVHLTQGNLLSERITQAQRPVPAKGNSFTKKQQPVTEKKSVKKPPGTLPLTSLKRAQSSPVASNYTFPTGPPAGYLSNLKEDHLEIWGDVLGFARQGKLVKRDKFIQVLERTGFLLRKQKGAQASYKPPPNFESAHALTIHLPHGPNFEDVKLKNMAGTIKKQYPVMVSELYQRYTEL